MDKFIPRFHPYANYFRMVTGDLIPGAMTYIVVEYKRRWHFFLLFYRKTKRPARNCGKCHENAMKR